MIWHKNAGSSGGSGSKMHRYYHARNRILFGMRYAKTKTKMALLKQSLMKLGSNDEIEKKAVMDALLNKYGMQT